ncbi:MAG: sulfoxide reductase heme-binding subunit YedZ, partial [Gemmatimonadales bacterium]
FAFSYASLHLLIYLGLDQGFAWSFILEDVVERPFITVGAAAFLFLVPLAVTSTKGWIRRLGKRWRRLHRLVYLAAALGVVHFYWGVKADRLWPLVAATVLATLLLARVPWRSLRRM